MTAMLSLLSCASGTKDEQAMQQMALRLFPRHAAGFRFEQLKERGEDRYEIEAKQGVIHIRGNNANSMAVGLNDYLNRFCRTTVSWYAGDAVEMPDTLPAPPAQIAVTARCKHRFFLNYCTFGYTMPWWTWTEWERFIDWMALHGINLPLAITGQEAIWYRVWSKLGLTDEEIRNYFTGPAHLPWHRMINLDHWQGPLPQAWLRTQEALQQQIVARERQFNMRPVLPAFSGHVPGELKRIYPEAKISRTSPWGGFADEYRSCFLDPLDSLFAVIQRSFLEEQTKLFGTDHIYGIDPFNEIDPPDWEPAFLANCSRQIYRSLTEVDPEAVWLQMSWLFYADRNRWSNDRIKAFLTAVPQGKMLLLDYYGEHTEVWRQTERYFGQPYLWCYLGNFGGNTMLAGNMRETGRRIARLFEEGGDNVTGLGSTLEGFDVNPLMYEYVLDKAWIREETDSLWMQQWADRRAGMPDSALRKAWALLYDSVYTTPAALGQGVLVNARPTLTGSGNWTTNPAVAYSNKTLFRVWEQMLQARTPQRAAYAYDVVNIGRQVLGNYFAQLRDEFAAAYAQKQLPRLIRKGEEMKQLLHDLDALLSTQSSFLLGKWIADARSWGADDASADYYEKNARTILTTWGDRAQSLNDYANRTWAGMVSGYYATRWEMFIDEVVQAASDRRPFDEAAFHDQVTQFEADWTTARAAYPTEPTGDSIELAVSLMNKYKPLIINH
jgi:alpha-N-acetylglucosaminidase